MSIGQQFIAANSFDEFWEGYDEAFAHAEVQRFRDWADREYPGEYAPTPANVKTITSFFEVNEIPYTLRNMKICFIYLRSEGLLEKESASEPKTIPTEGRARAYVNRHFPNLKAGSNEWTREFNRAMSEGIEDDDAATKYSGPSVERPLKSSQDQQIEADEIKRLRALDSNTSARKDAWNRPTVDVSPELRKLAAESRAANRNGGKKRHMSPGESRAKAAESFPELAGKRESPEMNLWSGRLQFNQNSDD